jgi:DNA end-binding protein Ku
MADPIWNGFLRLSLVSCRIDLSPATTDRKRVRLEPFNINTDNPVTQQFVDNRTGAIVSPEATVQAYEYADGRYLVISGDELKELGGAPSEILDIDHFIPLGTVDRLFFEGFYYINPDGPLATDTLYTIRTAMLRNGQAGLGHLQLGGRERRVLVEPRGDGLMMTTLRSADQVEAAEFEFREEGDLPVEMIEIAAAIVARRSTTADPSTFRDRYDGSLRKLVEDKIRTGAAAAARSEPEAPREAVSPSAPPAAAAEGAADHDGAESEPAQNAALAAPAGPAAEEPAQPRLAFVAPPEPVATASDADPEAAADPVPVDVAPEPPALAEAAESTAGAAQAIPAQEEGDERGLEIFLHIFGLGERRFVGPGWAGMPGSQQPIEGLSIRPGEGLAHSAIEFRAFAPNGRATPWVTDGNYAGSQGSREPLTGFAVRPAEDHRDRVEIVYEGYFSQGGAVGPKRDGEICVSPIANDPLEAVLVRIEERPA